MKSVRDNDIKQLRKDLVFELRVPDGKQIDANFAELERRVAEFEEWHKVDPGKFREVITNHERRLAALEAAKPGDDKMATEADGLAELGELVKGKKYDVFYTQKHVDEIRASERQRAAGIVSKALWPAYAPTCQKIVAAIIDGAEAEKENL